jgi:N-acetylglucosamine kinase-like BadF-type ATPase
VKGGNQYWLGVDGGGTSTRSVVIDSTEQVLGEGRAEAANFLRVGLGAAVAHITGAVKEACDKAHIKPRDLAGACFGLAGVGSAKHRHAMYDALHEALQISSMTIETDARVALAGAANLEPGVVIIAGTGSIAYGVNSRGEYARAGGWGPAMGDEGSGHYIGRRALEAVVSAFDHRAPETSLTDDVCRYFGVTSPSELPPVIYDSPTEVVREIAQLSRIVVHAAREGDSVAHGILTDAAIELARAVAAVIERLKMQHHTFRVAYVGGVFEAGDLVIAPMRDSITMVAPHATVTAPLFPPVIGAAKLALAGSESREHVAS